jgi:hypothetical protein
MKRKLHINYVVLHILIQSFCLLVFDNIAISQNTIIPTLQQQHDSLLEKAPLETIHVHTDRNHYLVGDTLWYKSYVMDYSWGGNSEISGIIYIDLVDENGDIYIRNRQHLDKSSAAGYIPLIKERKIKPGRYYLRGYTQYLLNFGSNYIFKKIIEIDGGLPTPFQVKVDEIELQETPNTYKSVFPLSIRYFNTKQKPNTPLNINFVHKGNSFHKHPLLTDSTMIDIDFPKSFEIDNITMRIENEKSQLDLPFHLLTKNQQYDIQILPESGHFIEGLTSTFGVKALNPFGEGVTFTGVVTNKHGEIKAKTQSLFAGMSYLHLDQPSEADDQLTLTFANGLTQSISFPKAQKEGVIIQIERQSVLDEQYRFNIRLSPRYNDENLALVGFHRGKLVYGAYLPLGQSTHKVALKKSDLPYGIISLAILNGDGEVMSSRKVFNSENANQVDLQFKTQRDTFQTKSLVAVDFHLDGKTIDPEEVQLSLSVTDDAQVFHNNYESSILTQYFLQSEIQGFIEQPGFYFSENPSAQEALDNLMLTQGWVAYTPSLLAQLKYPKYPIEKKYGILGVALNVRDRGIERTPITIKGYGNSQFYLETQTDKEGRFFVSDEIPPFDSAYFEIVGLNKRNTSFNIGLKVHEEPYLILEHQTFPFPNRPWYLQINPQRQKLLEEQDKVELYSITGDTSRVMDHVLLEEVEILSQKFIPNSSNPNGSGQANLVYNQEDIQHIKYETLFDFFENHVPGLEVVSTASGLVYRINNRNAIFVFNGIMVRPEVANTSESEYGYFYRLFSNISMQDIVGVEVAYTPNYAAPFGNLHQQNYNAINFLLKNYAYIEITTRPHFKPFEKVSAYNENIKYIRPHPFHFNKQFYAPKYTRADDSFVLDRRATVHWEPNLNLSKKGRGEIQFYSTDRSGTYTIKIEGMDTKGNLIWGTQKINIKSPDQ